MRVSKFLIIVVLSFFSNVVFSQNDTMYIFQYGEIIGKYAISSVDSVTFYNQTVNTDDDTTEDDSDDFDITEILANTADNLILPQFEYLKESVIDLETAHNVFQASPTPSNLLNLQDKFKESYIYWQSCSFVNYGNSELKSLASNLNTYPTDTGEINSIYDLPNANLESAYYVNAIGFPGLDYILFSGSESDIINRLSNEGKDYCSKNIDLIKSKCEGANSYWKNNTDAFYANFKSDDSKSLGSGFSNFLNGFIKSVEVLKNGQLGFPAGKFTLNNPQPNESEALYSGISLTLYKAHLSNLKRVYKGEDLLGDNGVGLDDYLKTLGTTRNDKNLNELILETFNEMEILVNQLNGTTNEAIANQTSITDDLYKKTKELVAYLKVDMMNAFEVLINYMENDGD